MGSSRLRADPILPSPRSPGGSPTGVGTDVSFASVQHFPARADLWEEGARVPAFPWPRRPPVGMGSIREQRPAVARGSPLPVAWRDRPARPTSGFSAPKAPRSPSLAPFCLETLPVPAPAPAPPAPMSPRSFCLFHGPLHPGSLRPPPAPQSLPVLSPPPLHSLRHSVCTSVPVIDLGAAQGHGFTFRGVLGMHLGSRGGGCPRKQNSPDKGTAGETQWCSGTSICSAPLCAGALCWVLYTRLIYSLQWPWEEGGL